MKGKRFHLVAVEARGDFMGEELTQILKNRIQTGKDSYYKGRGKSIFRDSQ